jgi:hypothetical protein
LVTGSGEDRSEPNPSGEGQLKIIFLKRAADLWLGRLAHAYLYRLDALQSRLIAG